MLRTFFLSFMLFAVSDALLGQVISVSDTDFSQTLSVPDSAAENFTISNTGSEALTYSISGQANSQSSPITILLYNYSPAMGLDSISTAWTMNHLKSLISAELPSAIVTETDTEDPDLLAAMLEGKGVFLVPRIKECDPQIFTGFAEVLSNYTNEGGNVVFLGTDLFGENPVNNVVFTSGLFDGTINGFITNPQDKELLVVSSDDPIVEGVNASELYGAPTTFHYDIENDDATRIVGYDTGANVFDVVTTREMGQGRVVLIGCTYFSTNDDMTKILMNALQQNGVANEFYWLNVSPESGMVAPGEEVSIALDFDASLIPAGSYTVDLVISHNDATQEPIIVSCNLTTNGSAAIAVPNAVSFGSVVQTTSETILVEVLNPGADTLFVSNVSLSGDFPITISPTSFWVYPTLSTSIALTYSPTEIETFSVDLSIENNVESQVVTVTGESTGAPTMSISETDIVYNIDAGNVESTTIVLTNDGLGDLGYETDLTLSSGLLLDGVVSGFSEGGSVQISDAETGEMLYELDVSPGEIFLETISNLPADGLLEIEAFVESTDPNASLFIDAFNIIDLATGTEVVSNQFLADGFSVSFPGPTPLWLTSSPQEGVVTFVDGGSNSGDIEIVFDATNLVQGTYLTELLIYPSVPLSPQTITVTLNVTGLPAFEADQESIDFGSVLAGLFSALPLEIQNPGTAPLVVNDITFSPPNYTAFPGEFEIPPNGSEIIGVEFGPDNEGIFDGTMTLETNAGDFTISLLGEGIGAPAASVSPDFLEFFVVSGEMVNSSFTLLNQGEGPLQFELGAGAESTGFAITVTAGPDGIDLFYFVTEEGYYYGGQNGNQVVPANETFTFNVVGLAPASTYNFDAFVNAGSITELTIVDIGSGEVVSTSSDFQSINLGSPTLVSFVNVEEEEQELGFPDGITVPFSIDATGLSSGVYTTQINVLSNDPVNPVVVVTLVINVSAFPSASAGVNNTLQCGNASLQFMDQSENIPTSFVWNFGDGNTSTDQNPVHTYQEGGTYDVTLEACNTLGCDVIQLEDFITVDLACSAVSIQDNQEQIVETCTGFIYDSGGPDEEYFNNSLGQVTIAPPGASSITLSFSDFDYEEPFDGIQIFDGPDTSSPLLGEFSGNTLPPDITSTGSALTIVENSDANVGLNGFAASFTCSAPAIAPSADFVIDTSTTCSGLLISEDNSSNFPTSWSWDFGDGSTSNAPNPEHQYNSSGTYTVMLEVCNATGCDTHSEVISLDVLLPQVTAPFGTIGVGNTIQFQDDTEGASLWVWDFGDGNVSIGPSPMHTYNTAGVYELTVTIQNTNVSDCTVVYQQDIYVDIPFGIEDGDLFNLDYYPNPVSNELTIDLALDKNANTAILFYDLYGRLLFEKTYSGTELNERINVADYPVGIYNLIINVEGEHIARRVLISR